VTPALRERLPAGWEAARPEKGWERQAALTESLRFCREQTRRHATSFYFSSFPLPEGKKAAAFAIYAFCRWADDEIDEGLAEAAAANTEAVRGRMLGELDRLLAGQSELGFGIAFAEAVRQYAVPRAFLEDLIHGCCLDTQTREIVTYEELEVYCYYVASVVGLVMAKVFGLREETGVERAVEMGLAMQQTNILRDVGEDYAMGRIYLPREERECFGIGEEQLAAGRVDEAWRGLMRHQIERARGFYASAEPGLALLDADGSRLAGKVMSRVYGGILGAIERADYDVFSRRRYVPVWRKLGLAAGALAGGGISG